VNKTLKSLWRDELRHHLVQYERVILSRTEFHAIFPKVWDVLKSRRGLVVDGFNHCGLFPPRNPTCESEFVLAENYPSVSVPCTSSDTQNSLRIILPSPSKKANASNTKPHKDQLTSPQFVATKIVQVESCKKHLSTSSHSRVSARQVTEPRNSNPERATTFSASSVTPAQKRPKKVPQWENSQQVAVSANAFGRMLSKSGFDVKPVVAGHVRLVF
jgi:hypothetical protein